jgi:hypothetical protein
MSAIVMVSPTSRQQPVHQVQGGFPTLHTPRITLIERSLEIDDVIARGGDVRLVAVLLPEQELVDLGLREGILGQQRTAARQIADDGVRLGEAASVVELDRGNAAQWKGPEKLGCPGFSLHDVDMHPDIGQARPVGRVLDLEAVAGAEVTEDSHGTCCPPARRARRVRPTRLSLR